MRIKKADVLGKVVGPLECDAGTEEIYLVQIPEQKRYCRRSDLELVEEPEQDKGKLQRETGKPMFVKGQYVRLVLAPNTRQGTIEGITAEGGKVEYHFRQDPRFCEPTPGKFEAYLPEGELEPCQRPSDEEVNTINDLVKKSGPSGQGMSHGNRKD